MSIRSIMQIVDRGQKGPDPVDLRIVLVDLRDDEEDGRDGQGERKRGNERVCIEIQLFQGSRVGD
jgi:hypothetical protein